ncbi:efflux RND transporter periplasmic adaptor subunit [Pedobacter changchengzhani]|uniref:Efflux RND transporter periplasmic adaptor subunit n=1 Tax=Pedobacter changchengzhani TaxID=2529274 RepID=A0A4R5MH90_9SPHI|nr:efflux RND transporter periplasmic adaptor subunit [Pedobacter changchengzhani]TDG34872.1 efflux RND transporter periplasmic adaptor subunit [Pedobacter changchengzhani]
MKKRYIFYIILGLGLAYLVYYRISANNKIEGKGSGKGTKENKSAPPLNVDGMVVSLSKFDNDIEVTGNIDPNESVVLKSEVSGLVTGIYFKEGSNVTKGTTLVKVNDRDIQAQLQEALTKQKLSATTENRAKQLLAKGAISQEEYDAALADLKSYQSQSQLIRAQLAKTSIVAPFSGRIGLRSISTGVYLTPATVIANLVSTNPVKITFSIPDKYASLIKVGSEIIFTTDASPKGNKGKVYAIEPSINEATRTLQVRALAPNGDNALLPGSFAKVKLSLNTLNDAILIPTGAVIPVLKGKIVFVAKGGKAEERKVEAGTRTADNIVITSGLTAGDTVLVNGSMSMKKGSAVKVHLIKQ